MEKLIDRLLADSKVSNFHASIYKNGVASGREATGVTIWIGNKTETFACTWSNRLKFLQEVNYFLDNGVRQVLDEDVLLGL